MTHGFDSAPVAVLPIRPASFTWFLHRLGGYGQLVIGVERIDRANRELHPPARRWQPAPRSEMRTSDGDLQHHALRCDVTLLHLNRQIGQGPHEFGVIRPHAVAASAMIPPRLV